MPGMIKLKLKSRIQVHFYMELFVCPVVKDLQTVTDRSWSVETKLFYLCTESCSPRSIKIKTQRQTNMIENPIRLHARSPSI